jgi:hypothetical protein
MVEILFVQVVYSIFLSFLRSRPSRGRRVEDYLTCYAVSRASSSITFWDISTSISPSICTLFFIEIVLKDHLPSTEQPSNKKYTTKYSSQHNQFVNMGECSCSTCGQSGHACDKSCSCCTVCPSPPTFTFQALANTPLKH